MSPTRPSLLAACALALAAAACLVEGPIDDPDLVPPGTEPVFAPPREGKETNGPDLLGATLDPLGTTAHHLSVSTAATDARGGPVTVTFVGDAELKAVDGAGASFTGADPRFLGIVFATGLGAELKIVALRVDGPGVAYTIRHRGSASAAWTDPCANGGGEALVTRGRWSRAGEHEPTSGRITFACVDAAIGKCLRWGYLAGGTAGTTAWASHQACTRMVRADRCGTGASDTRASTPITFYDLHMGVVAPPPATFPGVTTWPPSHLDYFFDASWTASQARCLGKPRWQSLALDGECPQHLPDPRTDVNAAYCDENAPPADGEVYFINTARYMEVGLHEWAAPGGGDHVVTVRGFHAAGLATPPFPGEGYEYLGFDGLLPRAQPADVDPADVLQVYLFRHATTGDRVVTSAAPAAGYVNEGTEGWVFKQARPETIPLYEYRRGGDRMSTTRARDASYTLVRTIGYVYAARPAS